MAEKKTFDARCHVGEEEEMGRGGEDMGSSEKIGRDNEKMRGSEEEIRERSGGDGVKVKRIWRDVRRRRER